MANLWAISSLRDLSMDFPHGFASAKCPCFIHTEYSRDEFNLPVLPPKLTIMHLGRCGVIQGLMRSPMVVLIEVVGKAVTEL